MSELEATRKPNDEPKPAPADRARFLRARRRMLRAGALLLVAVAVASSMLFLPAGRPSALTADARRQLGHAASSAQAAAAEIVLADVRAEVTGSLRPDEIRGRASELIGRVRRAVEPLGRSDRVAADELDASVDELAERLRAGDAAVGEVLATLARLVSEAGR